MSEFNSGWSFPPQGSQARNEAPLKVFLDPDNRRYPYMSKDSSGEWKPDPAGLAAVRSRSAAQGDSSIFRRATEILNKLRKEKGEEPLSMEHNEFLQELNATMQIEALRYEISALLYRNERGENDALDKYSQLLQKATQLRQLVSDVALQSLLDDLIKDVREICSDEKAHKNTLQSLAYRFDLIKIASDGMAEALSVIVDSVESVNS